MTSDVTTEKAGLEIVMEKLIEHDEALLRLTAPEKAREILASLDA